MLFRTLCIICSIALLAACASVSSVPSGPRLVSGERPAVGEQTIARVGDDIYSTFNYYEIDVPAASVLSAPVKRSFVLQTIDAPVGAALEINKDGEHCTVEKVLIDPLVGPHESVCFRDTNGDGKFDQVGATPGLIRFWKDLDVPVGFEQRAARSTQISEIDAGGFKRELIFQGVDGATLRVQYREYIDNMARPAFSQDLTYPISKGKAEIVFKSLTISVQVIEPTQIHYSVLEGRL